MWEKEETELVFQVVQVLDLVMDPLHLLEMLGKMGVQEPMELDPFQ
jgi:hypothetical protein